MNIDFADLSEIQAYSLMTQTIVPRPIAWIVSENEDASLNLAPFSYFNALASDPPMIVVSVGNKKGHEPKDTRANITSRSDFVVHIAHVEQALAMTQSAAALPKGESEVEALNLKTAPFEGCRLPRIESCRIAFHCVYLESKRVQSQEFIFAEIKRLYVDDAITAQDSRGYLKISAEKLNPLGRLGGGEYSTMGEVLVVPRPG